MPQINLTWISLTKLDIDNISKINNNIHGVFRLSYKHKDGNIYVFFVGGGNNIKEELKKLLEKEKDKDNECISSHLRSFECYFRYAELKQTEYINSVLGELYKFYQPACNEPIETNGNNIQINVT